MLNMIIAWGALKLLSFKPWTGPVTLWAARPAVKKRSDFPLGNHEKKGWVNKTLNMCSQFRARLKHGVEYYPTIKRRKKSRVRYHRYFGGLSNDPLPRSGNIKASKGSTSAKGMKGNISASFPLGLRRYLPGWPQDVSLFSFSNWQL